MATDAEFSSPALLGRSGSGAGSVASQRSSGSRGSDEAPFRQDRPAMDGRRSQTTAEDRRLSDAADSDNQHEDLRWDHQKDEVEETQPPHQANIPGPTESRSSHGEKSPAKINGHVRNEHSKVETSSPQKTLFFTQKEDVRNEYDEEEEAGGGGGEEEEQQPQHHQQQIKQEEKQQQESEEEASEYGDAVIIPSADHSPAAAPNGDSHARSALSARLDSVRSRPISSRTRPSFRDSGSLLSYTGSEIDAVAHVNMSGHDVRDNDHDLEDDDGNENDDDDDGGVNDDRGGDDEEEDAYDDDSVSLSIHLLDDDGSGDDSVAQEGRTSFSQRSGVGGRSLSASASASASARPSRHPEEDLSIQLQDLVDALRDYQTKLKNRMPQGDGGAERPRAAPTEGTSPWWNVEEDSHLQSTLASVTSLCASCRKSSARLRHQLQQARHLAETVSQELSLHAEACEVDDVSSPQGGHTDAVSRQPEEDDPDARAHLAHAVQTRAALERASLTLRCKAQELAAAEADMAETETTAAETRRAAAEASLQLQQAELTLAKDVEEGRGRAPEEFWEGPGQAVESDEEADETELGPGHGELPRVGSDTLVHRADSEGHLEEQRQRSILEKSSKSKSNIKNQDERGGHAPSEGVNEDRQMQQERQRRATPTRYLDDESPKPSHQQQHRKHMVPNGLQGEDRASVVQEADLSHTHQDSAVGSRRAEHNSPPRAPPAVYHAKAETVAGDSRLEGSIKHGEDGVHGGQAMAERTSSQSRSGGDHRVTTQDMSREERLLEDRTQSRQASTSRFTYSLTPGDWDTALGCVVRAAAGQTTLPLGQDDLQVTRVPLPSIHLPLQDCEELVSNVVQLLPAEHALHLSQMLTPYLCVCLPHCAPRSCPGREPVVRMRPLGTDVWKDVPTYDVSFEDIKEYKFVEARLRQFGTLCVVLRLKRDLVHLNRHSGKVMSSADSRVTVSWPNHVVKSPVSFSISVQLVDQNTVSELRKHADADCDHLMTSSPIVHCQGAVTSLLQPLTFALPCPPNPATRPQRPATSGPSSGPRRGPTEGATHNVERPATARLFYAYGKVEEEVEKDEVHVLCRQPEGGWGRLSEVHCHVNKKDIVTFQLLHTFDRLMLLRTHAGLSAHAIERMAHTVEHSLSFQSVRIILRQMARSPSHVILTCASAPCVERTLRSLAEEGFSQGPQPTAEVKLREGQMLELGFRGNVRSNGAATVTCLAYYSAIPFKTRLAVHQVDRFAQKGFDDYRGFLQVYATYGTPRKSGTLPPSHGNNSNNNNRTSSALSYFASGRQLLAELLVQLPKPQQEPPKPLHQAPVTLKSPGPVTNDVMRHVAQQLAGDDWRRLAPLLNVRRMRLQAILRQNVVSAPAWLPVYDLLVTWSKRLPQAFDRVDALCGALVTVGRTDLAEELREREATYRHNQALAAREAQLRKAFVRVARHAKAAEQWRRLALFLGLTEVEVDDVAARSGSGHQRCLLSLQLWKDRQDGTGMAATVSLLSHKLRLCRFRALAKEIDDVR